MNDLPAKNENMVNIAAHGDNENFEIFETHIKTSGQTFTFSNINLG